MIISASIEIYAPMDVVWEVFADIHQWREWNPVCTKCRFETGKALQAGACISFTLKPMFVPIRISPVVDVMEQGRQMVWSGGRFGIHAEHTFIFKQTEAPSVIIDSTEVFSGLMLWPARMLRLPARLHTLSIHLLEAIKTEAESRFKAVPEDLKEYVDWTGGFTGYWFCPLGVLRPDYGHRAFKLGMTGILVEIDRLRKSLSPAGS